MSFSATSGNSITQAQTDSDLSGLSGVSGVTVNTIGNTSYKVYAITRKLIVLGTLTIDPAKELLLVDTGANVNIQINGSGRINLGVSTRISDNHETGVAAGPIYGDGLGLVSGRDGPACCWNGSVNVESGGTLALYGSMLRVRGVMHLKSGANFISRDGKILVEPPSNLGTNVCRIRVDATSGVDIQGLTVWGAQFDILSASPFANFSGYDGRNVAVPVEVSPNASNRNLRGTRINVRSLPDTRPYTRAAMNNWRGAQDLRIFNSGAGSAARCIPDQVPAAPADGEGAFGGRIYHEAQIDVVDESGAGIEGARVYVRDTDHGGRVRATTTGSVTIDETADRIYSELTDAQGRRTHTILTGMWYRKNEVQDIAGPDGNEMVDVRGKTNTAGTDDFDVYVECYTHIRTSFEAVLKGADPYVRRVTLREDAAVTEKDKSVANAYAEWETAAKLYDGIKDAKTDDPTLGGLGAGIVSRNGDVLDFGSLNVVFADPAGHSTPRISFNDANDAITITTAASSLAANIRTAGTATIHADQTITGFVSDSSGTDSIIRVSTETESTTLAAYSATGDMLGMSQDNLVWHLRLTAAQSSAGIRFVCNRLGYAPKVSVLDASAGGAFRVDFLTLIENRLPSGLPMRVTDPAPDVTGISVAFALTDLSDVRMTMTIPDRAVRVQAVFEACETAQITEEGMKFLAFGGLQMRIDLNPTAGDTLYMRYAGTKLDADANSPNAQVIGNVWHPDGQPLLGDGSDPTIASGVSLPILSDAISSAVLWSDLDDNAVGRQSLGGEVLRCVRELTSGVHGNAAIKALLDTITGVNAASGVSLTQLMAVRDAIISELRGTGEDNTLTSIAGAVAGVDGGLTEAELTTALDALRGSNAAATLSAILAETNPNIDGTMNRNQVLKRLYAIVAGNAHVNDDRTRVGYRAEDGVTEEVAYNVDDAGNRTRE